MLSAENKLVNTASHTGLVLEQVTKSGAKTGTETCGGQGRCFFSENLIPVINDLTKDIHNIKHQKPLLELHARISVILRVISCNEEVNKPLFQQYCQDTIEHLHQTFPWALLNHTLHGCLQHSAELISRNDGYGLGALSEEGLEANNKDIREFLKSRSRKCDPVKQLTDVMHRLLERSEPIIAEKIRKLRPSSTRKQKIALPASHYDTLVNDLLM